MKCGAKITISLLVFMTAFLRWVVKCEQQKNVCLMKSLFWFVMERIRDYSPKGRSMSISPDYRRDSPQYHEKSRSPSRSPHFRRHNGHRSPSYHNSRKRKYCIHIIYIQYKSIINVLNSLILNNSYKFIMPLV